MNVPTRRRHAEQVTDREKVGRRRVDDVDRDVCHGAERNAALCPRQRSLRELSPQRRHGTRIVASDGRDPTWDEPHDERAKRRAQPADRPARRVARPKDANRLLLPAKVAQHDRATQLCADRPRRGERVMAVDFVDHEANRVARVAMERRLWRERELR